MDINNLLQRNIHCKFGFHKPTPVFIIETTNYTEKEGIIIEFKIDYLRCEVCGKRLDKDYFSKYNVYPDIGGSIKSEK